MGFFTGSRKLLTSRIQTQKIMKNEKIPLQIVENCGRETWYQFSLASSNSLNTTFMGCFCKPKNWKKF
jgi:hypothetical protein